MANDPQAKRTDESAEDRTAQGWPAFSRIPFVEPGYYDQFDPKVRPRFEAGGGSSLNMTAEEVSRVGANWSQPWKIVTVFNFSLQEHVLSIPGTRPGQAIQVSLMPLGIIRAPEAVLPIGKGMQGSSFAQVYPVPAEGQCKHQIMFKDPDSAGQKIETCPFSKCPDHPGFGLVHSIQQAYHLVQSIGEALAAEPGPDSPSAYTPSFAEASKRLIAYQELDPRQLVGMWASKRLMFLNRQENEIARKLMQGIAVGGR